VLCKKLSANDGKASVGLAVALDISISPGAVNTVKFQRLEARHKLKHGKTIRLRINLAELPNENGKTVFIPGVCRGDRNYESMTNPVWVDQA
jgi:hypothetical protein